MTSQSAGHASPNKAGRPSLYTNATESLQPVEARSDSILGGLEKSRPRGIRLIGLLGLGLASAIAVGWWQAGGLVREKDVVPTLAGSTQIESASAPAAVPTEPSAQPTHGEKARTADRLDEQMPAIVVTENDTANSMSTQIPDELSAGKPAAPGQVAESAVKEALQPTNSGDATAVMPMQVASGSIFTTSESAQEKVGKQAHLPGSAARAKHRASAAADLAQAAKSPSSAKAKDEHMNISKSVRPGEARNKLAEKDGDVELIAALLNRVSTKTEPAREEMLRKPSSGKGALRQTSGDQKKARKAALPPENVTSAEAQLKRCGSLNFLESELCRIRVCEGKWGRETGCPEYSHASAALP